MLIKLDLESNTAIYEQLRRQIILGMLSGKLAPGEALPSVRQFAADLGINLHTVNKAYNLLKQDGYVIIHRQRGVVIADSPPTITEEFRQMFIESIKPYFAEALLRGADKDLMASLTLEVVNQLKNIK